MRPLEFKNDSKIPGPSVDLEHLIRRGKGSRKCCTLERVAHAWSFLESAGQFQIQVQCFQGRSTGRAPFLLMCFFQGRTEVLQRMQFFPLEACQNKSARRRRAMTRRNWDIEPKTRQISNKEVHRGFEKCQLQLAGPKEWQNRKGDCSLHPVSAQRRCKVLFPIPDGTVKLSGGDQDLRTSTSIRADILQERVFFNPTTRLIMVWE